MWHIFAPVVYFGEYRRNEWGKEGGENAYSRFPGEFTAYSRTIYMYCSRFRGLVLINAHS